MEFAKLLCSVKIFIRFLPLCFLEFAVVVADFFPLMLTITWLLNPWRFKNPRWSVYCRTFPDSTCALLVVFSSGLVSFLLRQTCNTTLVTVGFQASKQQSMFVILCLVCWARAVSVVTIVWARCLWSVDCSELSTCCQRVVLFGSVKQSCVYVLGCVVGLLEH